MVDCSEIECREQTGSQVFKLYCTTDIVLMSLTPTFMRRDSVLLSCFGAPAKYPLFLAEPYQVVPILHNPSSALSKYLTSSQ